MKKAKVFSTLALFSVILGGCAATTDNEAHESFLRTMNFMVGKKVNETWINPRNTLGRKKLSNGNTEVEFDPNWVKGKHCRVFYQVDTKTNVVVGWRYEGDNTNCVWYGY